MRLAFDSKLTILIMANIQHTKKNCKFRIDNIPASPSRRRTATTIMCSQQLGSNTFDLTYIKIHFQSFIFRIHLQYYSYSCEHVTVRVYINRYVLGQKHFKVCNSELTYSSALSCVFFLSVRLYILFELMKYIYESSVLMCAHRLCEISSFRQ